EEDARLLSLFASAAAGAVHNARLLEETIRQLERLEALHSIEIAISASMDLRVTLDILLKQVTSQLKVDAAAVLLLNPHLHTLEFSAGHGFRTKAIEGTRLRLGESHAGRAALERHLVHVKNLKDAPDLILTEKLNEEGFVNFYALPLIAKGQVKGVLEIFIRTPFTPDNNWLNFLETLAGQAAIAIDSAQLFENLQRSNTDLINAYDRTIEGWSNALDLRDEETEGHSQRVTAMTLKLARASGMTEAELVHVRHGALLHDIGKMGVPDHILLKPDKLTDEEWVAMRKHPTFAHELLLPIAYLRPALDIPYCHHEQWDGTGYPRGLKA
ncbi:MAG: HD domain-containing phosphohydrolase, partial [Anaerolineales bacterium]|nr:HD domain-containing phosphohydrolase [Anaerolineales bacterium]